MSTLPEWIRDLTVVEIIALVVAVAGAVATVWKTWKMVAPFVHGISQFLSDWNGEPERKDGAGNVLEPAKPGVVAALHGLRTDVDLVKQQVQNSHKSNLREDIDKKASSKDVEELAQKVQEHIEESVPVREMLSELHQRYVVAPSTGSSPVVGLDPSSSSGGPPPAL